MLERQKMTHFKVLSLLLLALVSTACSVLPVVKKRAAYDFSCTADEIEVVEIANRQYAAKGCGKEGVYVCLSADGWVCSRERSKVE